jgi:hypothetical protein
MRSNQLRLEFEFGTSSISGPQAGPMRLARVDRVYQGWLDKEVRKLIELLLDPV